MARPSHASRWVAETRFSGVIAELALPRVTVRDLLPPELVLERGHGTARTYPLLTMFGEQTGSAVHVASMQVRTGVQFHEVLFGVRCVVERSGTPVLFIPLMYCDEPVSRWSGNVLYGFNKQAAEMEWLGNSFVATSPGPERTRVLLEALMVEAPIVEASRNDPHVRAVRAAVARPIVGRRSDGNVTTTIFLWCFERASIHRSSCSVRTQIHPAPFDGVECLHVSALGWRIGWPDGVKGGESPAGRSSSIGDVTRGVGASQGHEDVLRVPTSIFDQTVECRGGPNAKD